MQNQDFKLTNNQYGLMHKNLNPISSAFIDYAIQCSGTVLDIGAAYGVASIPILENSANTRVIACDISKEHLEQLCEHAKEIESHSEKKLINRLMIIHEKFPDFALEKNSLYAVLAAHVLPFLTGDEIVSGLTKVYNSLKSGGKLFVLSYTIYNKLMRNYVSMYEQRKIQGDLWPGELADASLFWDAENPLSAILPKKLNHLEPCILKPILLELGFEIEFLSFLSLHNEIPDELKLDGREVVGLIATKN